MCLQHFFASCSFILSEEKWSASRSLPAGAAAGRSARAVLAGGKKPMNHNVRLSLVFSALSGASNGVWGWQVLAMYLFVLTGGSNAKVGLCEGIQGAFKAAAALPAGVLADRWRRDLILRASAAVAVVAIAVTSFALLWSSSERNEYIAICVGCTLWGIFNGLSSPALEAIFADSCPTGDRSRMYTLKYVAGVLPFWGVGPLITMALFGALGDTWTLGVLRPIMLAGMALAVPPTLVLLRFDDERSLGLESDSVGQQEKQQQQQQQQQRQREEQEEQGGQGGRAGDAADEDDGEDEHAHEEAVQRRGRLSATARKQAQGSGRGMCCCRRGGCISTATVPFVVVVVDIIIALASGMTIKFFPIWFGASRRWCARRSAVRRGGGWREPPTSRRSLARSLLTSCSPAPSLPSSRSAPASRPPALPPTNSERGGHGPARHHRHLPGLDAGALRVHRAGAAALQAAGARRHRHPRPRARHPVPRRDGAAAGAVAPRLPHVRHLCRAHSGEQRAVPAAKECPDGLRVQGGARQGE
jgi:MFS family permease